MGNVVQAGVGPNPARLAAVRGGIPMSVPATTVNKLCLSGLAAIAQAAWPVIAGQSDVVVAGGMESMSNAPHLLPGARGGFKYGPGVLLDALDSDALMCGFDGISMGAATERYQAGLGISRADQDAFCGRVPWAAAAAIKAGRLAEEITPVTVPRKGNVAVEQDEGVRPGTTAQRLRPDCRSPLPSEGGTITAGSASQLSDGACAVVVMSKDRASRLDCRLAEDRCQRLGRGSRPLADAAARKRGPRRAAPRRHPGRGRPGPDRDQRGIRRIAAIASARDLGATADRVNVNGGAIAIGHPVGMSGARLVLTLALELRRRGGGTGAAAGALRRPGRVPLSSASVVTYAMGRLDNKVALVTGGNSGIGLAIAHRFVEEGAYVYITGRRAGELGKVTAEIGRNIAAVQGDITDLGHLDDLYQRIAAEKGVPGHPRRRQCRLCRVNHPGGCHARALRPDIRHQHARRLLHRPEGPAVAP